MPLSKACISGAVKNLDIYSDLNNSWNAFWTSNVFCQETSINEWCLTRKDVDEVERKSISNEEATDEKVQREEGIALGELRASCNSRVWWENEGHKMERELSSGRSVDLRVHR